MTEEKVLVGVPTFVGDADKREIKSGETLVVRGGSSLFG